MTIRARGWWAALAFLAVVGCQKKDATQLQDPEGHHVLDQDGGDTNTGPTDGGDLLPTPDGGSDPGNPGDGGGGGTSTPFRSAAPNPIPTENAQPGDPSWFSGRQGNAGQVELYTSIESLFAGDSMSVKVSTDSAQNVTAAIYRLGDYGGAGARKLWTGGPYATNKQAFCPHDPNTQRVECQWTDTFSLTIPADWVSGVYLVKVTRPDNYRRFAAFVVKDHRAAEILYQPAFDTYEAYDNWGNESLYGDGSGTMPSGLAVEVSYDRPLSGGDGTGYLMSQELSFIQLLERYGYDVTYGTNVDFVRHSNFLDGIGAFVSSGHDEYWPNEERVQMDAAVASGKTSVAYFGANGGYWRVRMTPDTQGNPNRTVVCYKLDPRDPIPNSTIRYRDDPNAHPENALWGVMYVDWMLVGFPMIVKDPSHWMFQGTGVTAGTKLLGQVGFEFDRIFDNGLTPPGVQVAMESPVVSAEAIPSMSQAVTRITPSGTLVFAAGSIWWPQALYRNTELYDARVERMTLNVLERAVAHRRPAKSYNVPTGPIPTEGSANPCASSVAAVAGNGYAGYMDGPGAQAQFAGPTGIAVTGNGRIIVADTGSNRIRMIGTDPQHTVTTIAGNGDLGLRDGDGVQAMFRAPSGVAVGPDGAVYVADSDNHNIRRITLTAGYPVTTFAGGARKQGSTDGPLSVARFNRPTALAFGPDGRLYVADQAGNKIRMIDLAAGTVTTIAGSNSGGFVDASLGTNARFNNPSAIAVAPTGEIYVYDGGNQRLRRISADTNHAVTTIAGDPNNSVGFNDGTGNVARFRAQMGIAVSPQGEVMLADTANFRIRKIIPGADMGSTNVYTLAGNGMPGTQLGSGDLANVVAPAGIAFAPNGLIYYSDSFNSVIRSITR